MSVQPINATEIARLSRSFVLACKTRNPSKLIRLMSKDAVWRDNDAVHVGRDEIWGALNDKWASSLHCTLQQSIESIDTETVVIQFESEWQHSVCGRWFRTTGRIRASVGVHGAITTIESRITDTPISVGDRRLSIAMRTTPSANRTSEGFRSNDQ